MDTSSPYKNSPPISMIEDRHPKRQFTVKDHVGNLETGPENMTGHLDLNPGLLEMSPEKSTLSLDV
jgi:hypothetical protein